MLDVFTYYTVGNWNPNISETYNLGSSIKITFGCHSKTRPTIVQFLGCCSKKGPKMHKWAKNQTVLICNLNTNHMQTVDGFLLLEYWTSPVQYSGGWNTECLRNSNGSTLFDFPIVFSFPMVFGFEQNGSHFVQNHWKSEQNGSHFVWISIGSVIRSSNVK